jgi:hypothetical protein
MGSKYNMVPLPAVVFVSKGDARLAIWRVKFEDLLARDMVAG